MSCVGCNSSAHQDSYHLYCFSTQQAPYNEFYFDETINIHYDGTVGEWFEIDLDTALYNTFYSLEGEELQTTFVANRISEWCVDPKDSLLSIKKIEINSKIDLDAYGDEVLQRMRDPKN